MTLKVGVCIRFKNPEPWRKPWADVYDDGIAYARAAEGLGFDGVWVPEHHSVTTGYNPTPMSVLAALARETSRCWLGTQPLLLPLYNPVQVAEEAAVVDVLSHGRLILGVGGGYRHGDFEALGIDRATRGRRMDEGLELLLATLERPGPFDFAGRFYNGAGIDLHPRPIQSPRPEIIVSARSDAAAARAARHGLAVNLRSTDGIRRYGPSYARACRASGLDPAIPGTSVMLSGFLTDSVEQAMAAVQPYHEWEQREYREWKRRSTDPEDVRAVESPVAAAPSGLFTTEAWLAGARADIEAAAASGLRLDWLNVTLWPPGMALPEALACLERFAAEVLHAMRNLEPAAAAAAP